MKANNRYEYEVYKKVLANNWLKLIMNNIETYESRYHASPTYGTLSEEEYEHNMRISKDITEAKAEFCKLVREIRRATWK